jgi:hypothetical protein
MNGQPLLAGFHQKVRVVKARAFAIRGLITGLAVSHAKTEL